MPSSEKSDKNILPYITSAPDASELTDRLLVWYDTHRRAMPWRALPGCLPNVYHVWLSEIMLQQTTVATVKGYFEKFTDRWPTLADLAAASLDDVLVAWAGLGYYARARNMHKCARVVMEEHDGIFPRSVSELLKLPGIGPYTAGAVSAIGYNEFAVVVDGNVERVITRLHRIDEVLPKAKVQIFQQTEALTSQTRPGDFAQAMMDLGAVLCRPKNPQCLLCPLQEGCLAQRAGDAEAYPVKPAKAARPVRRGQVFYIENAIGEVFLRRREEKGLLGGMMELPGTEWTEVTKKGKARCEDVPQPLFAALSEAHWQKIPGTVKHVFTHFELYLEVYCGRLEKVEETALTRQENGKWVLFADLEQEALPSVMKKVVKAVRNYGA